MLDEHKRAYRKGAAFLVISQFCERYAFFGISIILPLYLRDVLHFTDGTATTLYHVFATVSLCTPIVGGILGDSFLGKYKTILYFSVLYLIGAVLLTLTTVPSLKLPLGLGVATSLILIATGSGIIKPVISAYGGDLFRVPKEEKKREKFFSILFGFVNAGVVATTLVTPILRNDVSCFGDTTCYASAFGVPSILLGLSIVIFLGGTSSYKEMPLTENILLKSIKCITHALSQKIKTFRQAQSEKAHWLDYSEPKFDKNLIRDIRAVFKILILYLPLPIYFALFDQQISKWTFQASRMDGNIYDIYTIKPDQFQVMNSILTLSLIPFCDKIFYPILAKCGLLTRPLQRLTTGCVLGSVSFVLCGLVELKIEEGDLTGLVHMIWLLPQYVVISLSEVILTVTLMEFSYAQAPASMKSFLQSVWLVTAGLGNVIVIIVAEVKIFESQALEFFLFAGLNLINSFIFILLAINFEPMALSSTSTSGDEPSDNHQNQNIGLENENCQHL